MYPFINNGYPRNQKKPKDEFNDNFFSPFSVIGFAS